MSKIYKAFVPKGTIATVMCMDLNHLLRRLISYIFLTIITPLSWSPLLNSLLEKKSGGYRSRTDDPLRARQVL